MYLGKQRIIMFIGCDRCGKTNIAHKLSTVTGMPVFKASSEHDAFLSCKTSKRELFLNQLRYADPRVFDILKQTGWSIIFDRGFPCEYAYSKVMGRETDQEMLRHMDEMWATLGTEIIWCQRKSYEGIADDIDPTMAGAKLQAIHDAYEEFAARTRCSVLRLNVDDEDLCREVNDILQFMGWQKRLRCGAV